MLVGTRTESPSIIDYWVSQVRRVSSAGGAYQQA